MAYDPQRQLVSNVMNLLLRLRHPTCLAQLLCDASGIGADIRLGQGWRMRRLTAVRAELLATGRFAPTAGAAEIHSLLARW
jgi:hypothetical protein